MGDWQRLFGLDPQLIFDACVLAVNIFILFLFLSYILFNPARKMLEKRREKVTGDIEAAREALAEAQAMKTQYEAKLREVDTEVTTILGDARKKAVKNEEAVLVQAKQEAARIVQHGQEQIELEYQKASDEMKKQIVDIAAIIAAKAVRDQMNEKENQKLVEEALKEMGEDVWQS